jgi:stringent starvation protein B
MTADSSTTSRRPYLLRAMHEWITDNRQTPHVVVDATVPGVVVPVQHVRDGKIVLNVDYGATAQLFIKNDGISFSARFGGVPFQVYLPVPAVLGIYARETGQGMIFSDEDAGPPPADPTPSPVDTSSVAESRRAKFTVVK